MFGSSTDGSDAMRKLHDDQTSRRDNGVGHGDSTVALAARVPDVPQGQRGGALRSTDATKTTPTSRSMSGWSDRDPRQSHSASNVITD